MRIDGGVQAVVHVLSCKTAQMITGNESTMALRHVVLPLVRRPMDYRGVDPVPTLPRAGGVLPVVADEPVSLPGLLLSELLLEREGESPLAPELPLPLVPEAPLDLATGLCFACDFFLLEACLPLRPSGAMSVESDDVALWPCASCWACCSTAAIFPESVLSIISLLAFWANDAPDNV